jgi:acylphosphatase
MATRRSVRGVVRGHVQGVAYRASFRREPLARGLTGWISNHTDGSVEFALQGGRATVQEVLNWARKGPPLARVADVAFKDVDYDTGLASFEIRY